MKKLIKKWLGIDKIEQEVSSSLIENGQTVFGERIVSLCSHEGNLYMATNRRLYVKAYEQDVWQLIRQI